MSVEIRFEGRILTIPAGATVLEGLEHAGIAAPSSCRAGACQFCMMRVVDGPIPPHSQDGLKESLKKTGHFLTCVSRPLAPFSCESANVAAFRGAAVIQEIRPIGPDIARVRFARPAGFDFTPGQFVTVRREDGLGRSYSIASRAAQRDHFDLHVHRVVNGRMSGWLHRDARPGDTLRMEGPKGDCCYYPGSPDQPLTLVGTGTGMAPLVAIAEDALLQGHRGSITIYQGALREDRLYLVQEIQAMAAAHPNVRYVRCVLGGPASEGIHVGDLESLVASGIEAPARRRAYLCGDPGTVRRLKKCLFLKGLSMSRLHADPFVGTDGE